MTPPPLFPFHDPTEALEALIEGTYWPRLARYADHMRAWLATERPALGVRPKTVPDGQLDIFGGEAA